ncbi:HD-GYP domain-containing protein [Bowmanella denitrificans]|uniref:HD-GYP domain-containing protein n=1 Tax=Bowmanella denitrificans TaxID=366582 RepID=UPI000C9BCFC7|nr:HD-GYP domain-containing protein [Bowmanella denitrificans]
MAKLKIHPDSLRLGMYVKLPSGWMKHPFLFNSFKLSSHEQIRVIRALKLPYILIDADKSDVQPQEEVQLAPEPVLDEDTQQLREQMEQDKHQRIEQLKQFRRSLQKTEKNFQRSLVQVRNLMTKVGSRPLQAVEEAQQLISDMADIILGEENVALHLMNPDKQGDNLYYHSLNVAVLAMMLARQGQLSREQGQKLGLAALFHDVGKLKIPSQVLRKTDALSKPEENLLKMHCQYGVDLLSHSDAFPGDILPVILQHHEHIDGSGYPRGLSGKAIDPLAQILMLVNEYDNLCHPRDPAKAKIPYQALSFLFKNMKAKLPDKETKMLVKLLGVYPPGTVVMLSDNRVGMVISVNTSDLLNPSLLMYDASVPSTEAPMISLKEHDLSILKVIKPSQLPPPIFEYLNPRARISYFVDKAG